MKIQFKHIAIQLLLPLIIIFQFGQANFIHFHVSKEGRVVAHSHPYQIQDNEEEGQPSPGHHHSNSEFAFLQFFDGSFTDGPDVLICELPFSNNYPKRIETFNFQLISRLHEKHVLLRGPPKV